ncbi:MAG: 16S rRNA (adenine(1518)-N(6)/adenine(1519)-N(6))-dimethyltransferase RsmA [Bacillota bacterium]|nr:16S rRNA (adenine(1518)-N(6)/adenine(1519)-N(6))-dimethyltransferase RsmA [Bacillota bacterium]
MGRRSEFLRRWLAEYGLRPKKRFGQNFLVDEQVLKAIVEASSLHQDEPVLEIGAGLGVLTCALAETGARVVAVEKDRELLPFLRRAVAPYPNVRLAEGDILDLDLRGLWTPAELAQGFKVVANLPYYIATAVLSRLLEADLPWRAMVVMVQEEVADRLLAGPGGKEYGYLSVFVQYYAHVEKIRRVPPAAFYPAPAVYSALVRLTPRRPPAVAVRDPAFFFAVVRGAFAQRRKTVLNSLAAALGRDKAEVAEALRRVGINPTRRGETLSLQELAGLAEVLWRNGS